MVPGAKPIYHALLIHLYSSLRVMLSKREKKCCVSQEIVSIGTTDPEASHTSGRLIRQVNRSCQSEVGLNECHQ